MGKLEFIEGVVRPDEIKEKALLEKKQLNNVDANRYASDDAFKTVWNGEVFDLEENKKKIIDDLNWLKSMSVEEFTFRKKYEEAQLANNDVKGFATQAKARIWKPTDINNEELTIKEINALQPKVVVVDESQERFWTTLRVYCSTAEYNQAPGRFIKFLMVKFIQFLNLLKKMWFLGLVN